MEIPKFGDFQQKVGPIPEWGWVIVILGVGYYIYKRKQNTAAQSTSTTNTADQTGVTAGSGDLTSAELTAQYDELNALGLNTSELGILDSGVTAQTGATSSNTSAIGSNTAAVGANTKTEASNTLATNANTSAITKAPIAKAAPKTAPKPAPGVNRTTHIYTVVRGDTLSGIANKVAKLWGVKESWQTIYAANKAVIGSNPNEIKPGMKIKVG